jgi:hypothetical protein
MFKSNLLNTSFGVGIPVFMTGCFSRRLDLSCDSSCDSGGGLDSMAVGPRELCRFKRELK